MSTIQKKSNQAQGDHKRLGPRRQLRVQVVTQLARHEIDRLCVLQLAQGLMDAAADPICDGGLPAEVKGKAAVICSQIIQKIESAARMEPDGRDNPRFVNSLNRMDAVIEKSFAEGVDAREGIAVVMARVAKEEEALNDLWNKKINDANLHVKTLVWSQLHELLAQLYDTIAPGKTDTEQIDKAAAVAEALCRA